MAHPAEKNLDLDIQRTGIPAFKRVGRKRRGGGGGSVGFGGGHRLELCRMPESQRGLDHPFRGTGEGLSFYRAEKRWLANLAA